MKTLRPETIRNAFPDVRFFGYGNDCFIGKLSFPQLGRADILPPCTFEGVIIMYVLKGDMSLTIGYNDYNVGSGSMCISFPGEFMRMTRQKGYTDSIRFDILVLSSKMFHLFDFDPNGAATRLRTRVVQADASTKLLLRAYRELINSISRMSHREAERSMGFVLHSMSIEISHLWPRLLAANRQKTAVKSPDKELFDQFSLLVTENCTQQRKTEFYAQSLGVTERHLCQVVMKNSGKKTAQFIRDALVLECCSTLKFSSKPILEIAQELGFPNQQSFYRFFLRSTGMPPSEYRSTKETPSAARL